MQSTSRKNSNIHTRSSPYFFFLNGLHQDSTHSVGAVDVVALGKLLPLLLNHESVGHGEHLNSGLALGGDVHVLRHHAVGARDVCEAENAAVVRVRVRDRVKLARELAEHLHASSLLGGVVLVDLGLVLCRGTLLLQELRCVYAGNVSCGMLLDCMCV